MGSGQLETKFYKKLNNLAVKNTESELKSYLGNVLFEQLQKLGTFWSTIVIYAHWTNNIFFLITETATGLKAYPKEQ